jgi:chromate reductase
MTKTIKVLGISGSIRKGSHNTGLLRAAVELQPPGMEIEVFDLSPLPLYNADNDGESKPESVNRFKSTIARADALLIATPEYNYSIPGVLKNAIDWASRGGKESPLNGKPIAIFGAGGVMGTVRAQMHLRQIVLFNGMYTLPKPELYVANSGEKFDPSGILRDEPTRERIKKLLEEFLRWTLRFTV